MTKPIRPDVDHRSMKGVDKKKGMLELLAARPYDTHEMAGAIGYSVSFVRRRLLELMNAGRIHRERVTTMYGFTHRWYLGKTPAVMLDSDDGPAVHQVTIRDYPPVNRRDPLVAALFGSPGARP